MRFECDRSKSKQNLAKHDVDFQTAELVFDDPYAVTIRDLIHDDEEDRYITLGEIGPGGSFSSSTPGLPTKVKKSFG
jgi:uncharacterized DUF497 family protein